jgi:predicted dehydrogenase
MKKKLRVGVIGLGMMGMTHLDIYARMDGVEVVAISDAIQARLDGSSQAQGNIKGQAKGNVEKFNAKQYLNGIDLIKDKNVDLVDICVLNEIDAI